MKKGYQILIGLIVFASIGCASPNGWKITEEKKQPKTVQITSDGPFRVYKTSVDTSEFIVFLVGPSGIAVVKNK